MLFLLQLNRTLMELLNKFFEGADVFICDLTLKREPGELGGNRRPLTGDHYPAICLYPCSKPGRGSDKRVFYNPLIRLKKG